MSVLWVNGRLLPADGPHLSARDRGFTLGDGLFETIRVRRGRILHLERHLSRLRTGASLLLLALPYSDQDLAEAVQAVLAANGSTDAVVRLTISRGVPRQRGLLPEASALPSLVVDAQPFTGYPAELYERGMHLITSAIRRNEQSPSTRAKTLNYLDNILARRAASEAHADEAVMLNTHGAIAGATAANIFLVRGSQLVTPDPASGALPGVTRAIVLEVLAPVLGLSTAERPVAIDELPGAAECFLTNALLGIMPAVRLDGDPIGTGQPGAVTRRLQSALEELSS